MKTRREGREGNTKGDNWKSKLERGAPAPHRDGGRHENTMNLAEIAESAKNEENRLSPVFPLRSLRLCERYVFCVRLCRVSRGSEPVVAEPRSLRVSPPVDRRPAAGPGIQAM